MKFNKLEIQKMPFQNNRKGSSSKRVFSNSFEYSNIRKNKKAIESYVIVLLIISACLTLLITTVFSPLFAVDHQSCKNIDYSITSKKKTDAGVSFVIKNDGNSKIYFQFDLKKDLKNPLMPNEEKEYKVNTKENKVTIYPLYIDLQENSYQCKGKKRTENILI